MTANGIAFLSGRSLIRRRLIQGAAAAGAILAVPRPAARRF
jgi:hypothetical protein